MTASPDQSAPSVLAVNVGNTTVQIACVQGVRVGRVGRVAATEQDPAAARKAIEEALSHSSAPLERVAVASVNDEAAQRIERALGAVEALEGLPVDRVGGAALPVPIAHELGPDHTTGVDRLLAAAAAYDAVKQACAVIDAGTAITIDFVDGQGVYHGGVIAPGLAMGLRALAREAAQLPSVEPALPDPEEPFPKTTRQAMRAGVWCAARGLTRFVVERFAERYGAYPRVVATGGDADSLFAEDPFVDLIAPHLVLRGVGLACLAQRHGLQGPSSAGLSAL